METKAIFVSFPNNTKTMTKITDRAVDSQKMERSSIISTQLLMWEETNRPKG